MRNRVIYQTEALYLSYDSSGSQFQDGVIKDTGGIRRNLSFNHASGNRVEQLYRIQSANYGFSLERTAINQYGELARIGSVVKSAPTVDLEFTYYLADAYNEMLLGMAINGSANAFYPFLKSPSKNYFILTGPAGEDLNNTDITRAATKKSVISIGNGFISSYNVRAAVDDFPTATVTLMASNIKSNTGVENILHPGINQSIGVPNCTYKFSLPDPTTDFVYIAADAAGCTTYITGQKALLPGDICMNLNDYSAMSLQNNRAPGEGVCRPCSGVCSFRDGAAHIQSFEISVDFGIDKVKQLGNRFPYAYFINPLSVVNLTVNALVGDMKVGGLWDMLCSGKKDIDIYFYPPCATSICNDSGIAPNIVYSFRGATFNGEAFTSAIGDNKLVELTFDVPLGAATDTTAGFFISGNAFDSDFLLREDQAAAISEECPDYVEQEAIEALFKLEKARGT